MNPPETTLMIVDDKKRNLFALEELLHKKGRKFIRAGSGPKALKQLLEKPVDLILLDVHMPGMDGFEVAKTLKSNKKTSDIPILFTSAEKKEHEYILKGFKGGAIDYLTKPLDPDITRAKVDALLKIQTQQRELVEKDKLLKKANDELEKKVYQRTAELEKTNAELKNTLVTLEKTNKRLEEFAYVITHDFRAPIINLQSLIALYEPAEKGRDIFDKICFSVNHLSSVLQDLINIVVLNKPSNDIRMIRFDEMLEAVSKTIEDQVISSQAKITSDFSQAPSITYSYLHLQSIVFNLLTNAIKYRSPGKKPEVNFTTAVKNEFICLTVSDKGMGIDLEKYGDRIFKAFQTFQTGSKEKGLGLYLVKLQTELFNGKIEVKSKPGKGTTFNIYLSAKGGSASGGNDNPSLS